MPSEAKRATSVQPSFACGAPPIAARKSAAAGSPSRGGAAGARVGEHALERREQLLHVRERLGLGAVRREPVVDRDRAAVGDDVAGDPALDPYGVEALAVFAAVDRHPPRLVLRQPGQHLAGGVDRVVAEPRPGGVRALAGRDDEDPQRALAAGLDPVARWAP